MKDVVLVEFLIPVEKFAEYGHQIFLYNKDPSFEEINSTYEFETDEDGTYTEYVRKSFRMNSATASIIRLSHPVGDYMRISYIPESLKDKYRTKK